MSLSKSKPVLGYWHIRGFGQPIRFLLKYLQIDYEEKQYECNLEIKYKEWDTVKDTLGLAFPNLPYWIDEKVKLTESRAIIKYLAEEYDPSLLPQNTTENHNANMVDGVVTDIWLLLVDVGYSNSNESIQEYTRTVPKKLHQMSAFMTTLGNPWCLGPKLSYLDFLFYEILYHNLVYNPLILDELPKLTKFMENFEKIPSVAEFIKSSEYIKGPCFRAWAKLLI